MFFVYKVRYNKIGIRHFSKLWNNFVFNSNKIIYIVILI